MKKQTRSYLQMQFEEAKLESGRYNTDYELQNPAPLGPTALLNAFRSTAVRLGADFNRPSNSEVGLASIKHN